MELTDILLSLIILTVLEVVLGIDNLIFLTIITQKLPLNQQPKARKIGLTLAWVSRLLMLRFCYLDNQTDYAFNHLVWFFIFGTRFIFISWRVIFII